MNEKRQFLIAVILFILYTLAMGWLQSENNKESFERGFNAGKSAAQAESREFTTELALQWWTGTNDMDTVRKRLCGSYRPK